MKKTKYVRLVLITALLSSCSRTIYRQNSGDATETKDSSCICSPDSCNYLFDCDLWYYAFRPFIDYFNIFYPPSIYCTSIALSHSGVLRRGFGRPFLKASS